MATSTTNLGSLIGTQTGDDFDLATKSESSVSWFDRSSLTVDSMVMIASVPEDVWRARAPENQICEYLEGVVYMPPPASDEHQDEVSFFSFMLQGFVSERGLGRVRCGPAVLQLGPGKNLEPDIFVVPSGAGPHSPPALLIVEVLSQSTRSHDLGRKAAAYQEAKIPEVVFIDQDPPRMIVQTLVDDIYASTIMTEGVWTSASIAGFWIDVSWLWNEDRQKLLVCLQRILSGPSA
jgi:Uma2 family endonuclease